MSQSKVQEEIHGEKRSAEDEGEENAQGQQSKRQRVATDPSDPSSDDPNTVACQTSQPGLSVRGFASRDVGPDQMYALFRSQGEVEYLIWTPGPRRVAEARIMMKDQKGTFGALTWNQKNVWKYDLKVELLDFDQMDVNPGDSVHEFMLKEHEEESSEHDDEETRPKEGAPGLGDQDEA